MLELQLLLRLVFHITSRPKVKYIPNSPVTKRHLVTCSSACALEVVKVCETISLSLLYPGTHYFQTDAVTGSCDFSG